jgi:dihydropteroate synthase
MGILNVTPDSFSDGGKFLDPGAAVEHALRLAAEGADIIDMGAESTRPGSAGVPPAEQIERLLPVLTAFRKQSLLPVSIDTRSAPVAEACLDEGANIINDISAMRHGGRMAGLISHRGCLVILMHMQGTPETMQQQPRYADVVGDILTFFRERLKACACARIPRTRVWLDPGIGFGKTLDHNLDILRRLREFTALKCEIVIGVSRKSFLGALTNEPVPEKRVAASVAAALMAVQNGATILRVHDVAEHRAALAAAGAIMPPRNV